jgi:hypothetical protein
MNVTPVQPSIWKERYESLRQHFLERRQFLETDPLSLRVLLQTGVANWIYTWQSCVEAAPLRAPPPLPISFPLLATSACDPQSLAMLIARMAEAQLQPTRTL